MVRPAIAADVPALVQAYEWLFAAPGRRPDGWNPETAASRLEALLGLGSGTVLVTEDEHGFTGLCTIYLDILSVRYGQRAWIEDLAVHPERRSAGIGKALLDAAKDWARERGADHLELDSAFTRPDAHRFYEREGPSWDARSFGWVIG